MTRNHTYTIYYKPEFGEVKKVDVIAKSKANAYDIAFYEVIPSLEGTTPYSAWVDSVTYQNGNVRYFNTCEGNAY